MYMAITDTQARQIQLAIMYRLPVDVEPNRYLIISDGGDAFDAQLRKADAEAVRRGAIVDGAEDPLIIDTWRIA